MKNDIKRNVEDSDVKWSYLSEYENGIKRETPVEKIEFEEEGALALMIINEVVFLNSNWWKKDWPEAAQKSISINVNCNDVFAWGSADAETLPYSQIETLYKMWRKDPSWGAAVWCMIQRNQMPQKPVEKRIREAAIWDLDSLKLGTNIMDAKSQS